MTATFFKSYDQITDSKLWISHDFWPYMNYYGVTLVSAAAYAVDSGLTVSDEGTALDTTTYPAADSTNLWSALLTSATAGVYTFRLRGTFSDGSIQVFEFEITVYDPT